MGAPLCTRCLVPRLSSACASGLPPLLSMHSASLVCMMGCGFCCGDDHAAGFAVSLCLPDKRRRFRSCFFQPLCLRRTRSWRRAATISGSRFWIWRTSSWRRAATVSDDVGNRCWIWRTRSEQNGGCTMAPVLGLQCSWLAFATMSDASARAAS